MDNEHTYRVLAWWSSGKAGLAKSDSAPNAIHFTAPPQFGGVRGRWSPEDLLLCAIAACYTTTVRALADYAKLNYTDLEIEVHGNVRKVDSGYAFEEIAIRPVLTISNVEEQQRALRLLDKAKSLCLVSRAVAIPQRFEPEVRLNMGVEARTVSVTD
jgi:organic hydroperoxide reductase OsmC/OhrA